MNCRRVLVYVQHLLGIGHLKRASAVARALAKAGLEVTLVTGGMPVPGIRLDGLNAVQLSPAVAADSTFKVLLDVLGRPVDERWRQERREHLMSVWQAAEPHALIVELYPFGRRQMRFELVPLLEAANSAAHRPVVVCSVRDILGGGQKDPARQDQMLSEFDRNFDKLIVHADPSIIPFEKSFKHASRIGSRLHYTGYVVETIVRDGAKGGTDSPGEGEVVVSAGGGAVGERLLGAAIRARPLSALAGRTWRILAGVNAGSAIFARLASLADEVGGGNVIVETSRDDFVDLIANCAVSISQGGYNTVVEILGVNARAVVVPFSGGGETEQEARAAVLAERGLIQRLGDAELTPENLARAVDRAAVQARPDGFVVDLDGARRSADLVSRWTQELTW